MATAPVTYGCRNEVDWWEPEALEEFLGRAQCVADFYSNYTEYGVHLNGEAECGENIADMGGVKFAFRGMQARARYLAITPMPSVERSHACVT